MARAVKNNKKGFFKYTGQQRKITETVCFPSPTMSETGHLATTDMEKAEIINNFLSQSSLESPLTIPPKSQNLKAGTGRMKYCPL